MPDVITTAPADVRIRCALDVHKRSIVAASEPEDPRDGGLELVEIPNTERALRRLVKRLGGHEGLVVCYEAGPCGYAPYRLLTEIGVACDVVAPSLTPRQLAALEREIAAIARTEPWSDPVRWLCAFRGIAELTALGLLAEIGDFRRFHSARELMGFLGLTPSEYSSGEERHRGSITKSGNEHARRLLVEAAWHYQHRPRLAARHRAQAGEGTGGGA